MAIQATNIRLAQRVCLSRLLGAWSRRSLPYCYFKNLRISSVTEAVIMCRLATTVYEEWSSNAANFKNGKNIEDILLACRTVSMILALTSPQNILEMSFLLYVPIFPGCRKGKRAVS